MSTFKELKDIINEAVATANEANDFTLKRSPLGVLEKYQSPIGVEAWAQVNRNDAYQLYARSNFLTNLENLIRSGERLKITVLGDSWVAREDFSSALKEYMYQKYGFGGEGWISFAVLSSRGSQPNSARTTFARTGTWTDATSTESLHYESHSVSNTATVTITSTLTDAVVMYKKEPGAGTFRYRIDGGSWTNVDANTTSGLGKKFLAQSEDTGLHTIEIEWVSGTVEFFGAWLTNGSSGCVVNQLGNGGTTASDWNTCAVDDLWIEGLEYIGSDCVVTLLGMNEFLQDVAPATYYTNMNTLTTNLLAIDSLQDILYISPADSDFDQTYTITEYDDQLKALAVANDLPMFSGYDHFKPIAKAISRGLYDGDDPTAHLSALGYQVFGRAVGDAFFNTSISLEESGTWTPKIADAYTSGNIGTCTINTAYYKKDAFGWVTVTADLASVDTTGLTAENDFFIQGLPYAPVDGGNFVGTCTWNRLTSSDVQVTPQVISSTEKSIQFKGLVSGGTGDNVIVSDFNSGSTRIILSITYMS